MLEHNDEINIMPNVGTEMPTKMTWGQRYETFFDRKLRIF